MNLLEIINSLPEEIVEIHILAEYWFGPVFWTFEKFKNLKKLNLPGICLDKLVLQEIAETTTLVHLNIEFSYKHIGFPLFNKLVNLEYIKTWIESEIGDRIDRKRVLSTKVLNTIFDKCKNLKHLDIPCQHYDFATIPLDKWKNFKNLEYLTLRCDEIPVDLADTIVKYCKNLKHLWITQECYLISAKVVKKLTELENLESLVIDRKRFELSEKSIIAIANNCKKLKRLEFSYNGYIIPTGVDDDLSSPSVLNELSKLQYLEHLNLEGLNNVDNSTIIAIANNCKNLKTLDIQFCDGITETALDALEKLKNLVVTS
ncbi:F-box/LRR-repeat protein 17-like [Aphidius gifuensis]|uniref:F-box/LRR-repeat protein 17-like n=1 Tax=Aphidius gifuensis TaxID=684658 RepID=UPI001CDB9677|nr:F-box/LRR-repeat protein 17-like [Aphidius gifuensis]